MRIGFMSSAAPHWDLKTLLEQGRACGCSALEPRVEWKHRHGLERDQPANWARARQQAAAAGMVISAVALGTRLNRLSASERRAAVADVVAYAALAAEAGAMLLRVFGGPMPPAQTMADARPLVAAALGEAAAQCAPFGVTPCLETHDAFWNPVDVAWCLEHAGHANVGATWHAAHHVRHGVSVDAAFAVLRPWIRHVHAQEVPADLATFQPGMPPLPLGEAGDTMRRQLDLLAADGYAGTVSLEWLNSGETPADPVPVLHQYAAAMQRLLPPSAAPAAEP